jgi:transcriptional antiterminator
MKIIESTENCQTLLYELTDIKSLVAKLKVDKYKIVSDLRHVRGFLRVLRFHPSIKLTSTI